MALFFLLTGLAMFACNVISGGQGPGDLKVASLDQVKQATIQIEAQGTFADPEFGLVQNAAGRGSGFILDESGIAVTNNHVVTGAALLKVWVSGEDEPRNAKVLGVSECSDLAVIDIEGEGFSYLDWYDGSITTGLDVYAAGFPLGNPEFTLNRGIISKEKADGETQWASVDSVIEHDALINPGNSGGPLVTQEGAVVGLNYAGNAVTRQSFAISATVARTIIDHLRTGQDLDSLGVNGIAVLSEDQTFSGIWVSSVKSGSPAGNAGIQAGDIITKLEELVLARDSTMADYCDIIRTHEAEDVLSVEVLRYATQEILAGQINGESLAVVFSFDQALDDEVTDSGAYRGFVTVTDDSEAISLEIPREWTDVSGEPWADGGTVIGAAIGASSNLDDFWNSYDVPGVFFSASHSLVDVYTESALLDGFDLSDDCTNEGRYEFAASQHTGYYDMFSNCGAAGALVINVAAAPQERDYLIFIQVQIVSDADLEALDHILDSFRVIGELP